MAGGTVVGLDIGSSMMKVVEVRKGGGGVEVTALGIAPTPQDAFENSIIVDAQVLGKAVKDLLVKSGVTAKHVISSVSGQSAVVVRVIDVPQMSPAELAENMKWEVTRHVPFAVDEIIMDCKPIERPEGYAEGQNMDVLLAAAQMDLIDRHVQMLQTAGLKPDAIDVEPLAVGRTLLELDPNSYRQGHTVSIVNIGATVTDIGVFRDKLIAFSRTLPLAGDNFTRAIAEAFQTDIETAENYKREYAEVLFDQMPQAADPFGGGGLEGDGGFFTPDLSTPDFSTPPPPAASSSATPSGRMPFDFSTPGDAPPPPSEPMTDLAGNPIPQDAPMATGQPMPLGGSLSGSLEGEQHFMVPDISTAPVSASPTAPADDLGHSPNLPVPTSTGDPQRDAIRNQVFNAIAPILAELSQEIRRSLDYYRGKTIDPQIDEILLVGGSARLKGLAPFLESELGIPTRVADPLQNVQVTSKNFSQGHMSEVATQFPVSIGLGVRDMIAPPPAKKSKK